MRRALTLLATIGLSGGVLAQQAQAPVQTYLSDVGSNPSSTGGQSRLLHYLSSDMPIAVYIPLPDTNNAQALRDAAVRAVKAWQTAAPDVLQFVIVGQPGADTTTVQWQQLDGKVSSYRYAYSITSQNQYRYHATEIILDPRDSPAQIYRFALLAVGQAVGLLGRSPYPGDALSASPSGSISEGDVATLRALYNVPSGTVLKP